MNISKLNLDNVIFGYKHPLKTKWLKGELPSVTHGLYGDKLTKKNCTLEHLHCHSKNGPTILSNLALASKYKNNLRGNSDIKKFLTLDMIAQYLSQFIDVKIDGFNGNQYILDLLETFKKLGFKI